MEFSEWWECHGQRTIAFDAKSFALAGWNGRKMHGCCGLAEEVKEPEPKLLEDGR